MTNIPTHFIDKIITNVISYTEEDKIGSAFINAQEAVPICQTLIEIGNPQPFIGTSIKLGINTAYAFEAGTPKQKRPKAIDMGFYLLQYGEA